MINLSQGQQQAAALGLLIAALLLIFSLLVQPLLALFLQQGAAIHQLEDQLHRYQRLSAELEQTEQSLRQLRDATPDSGLYLPERRPSLASAWLQQHLNRLVSRSGGQLVSIQNAQPDTESPLQGVMLRVHLRSEINQLVPLFHALESGQPALFMQDLVITANTRRARTRSNRVIRRQRANPRLPPSLDVRFDLVGYTQREAP
ncbi:general secretion pathway protein M [Oceanisphaera litoralis]|uniref:type II secretion system protein GspM n=1 Tax=Oceanisphaera litoralis TaxID=225144 RepID=UPI001EF88D08|nr:type II secretion system protein GspM [Oceanisphaera litoralis]MBM7456047.1 general secretion pathway protein M [Oceanisphaera litoralis]